MGKTLHLKQFLLEKQKITGVKRILNTGFSKISDMRRTIYFDPLLRLLDRNNLALMTMQKSS